MKIYTKTGDKGETSLVNGERVAKYSLRVETYGTIDELNSIIGLAISFCNDEQIKADLSFLSNSLFSLGTDLANPNCSNNEGFLNDDITIFLENRIDEYTSTLPALTNFILPQGMHCACFLHQARTVCRRAERLIVKLSETENICRNALIFTNRLSDYLFVAARYINFRTNQQEIFWTKR